ncbi:hypothetical protein [Embleya sp. NPDC059237]|uniref:SEL1-like repeat protein n=1 Tax=Embleya sp. NPDC059237 TaxID=3346784 RepID=UPI0036C30725
MTEDAVGLTAAAELHRLLDDALAQSRLDKTTLARRVGLGRTTVQEAFRPGAVPSAGTVTLLARALGLDTAKLLELRRTAAEQVFERRAFGGHDAGPGCLIDQCDPHDLEVHPAGTARGTVSGRTARILPGYVERAHDGVLAAAVRDAKSGRSRMVVLVGSSSTGKTRACWEAVRPLAAHGWRLWHPWDPTRADAALADLHRVAPRTVVWLNEAQHYLGDPGVGEQIAAAVHTLLTAPDRQPVLVLGTLWPEYEARYIHLPRPGEPDAHSRTRELLAGRTVTVPDHFDHQALAQATQLATGDPLLADALNRTRDTGRLAQDLAGAPELLRTYERGTPPARALLKVAMDARRLGMGPHLPFAFLTDAALDPAYMGPHDWDDLDEDWAKIAFAELARPVHGKLAALRCIRFWPRTAAHTGVSPQTLPPPTRGPVYRLADYLEQHGRSERRYTCPPATFWEAAARHVTVAAELITLAHAASARSRYRHAAMLYQLAADAGHTHALMDLTMMREVAGDREGAERLARQAADAGHVFALVHLARLRRATGDTEAAGRLAAQAADTGNVFALIDLAKTERSAEDGEEAERLLRQAADTGDVDALIALAGMRGAAGDREGAERLLRQAADTGNVIALIALAGMREAAGDGEEAERLLRQAADTGNVIALIDLAMMRGAAGDGEEAERLLRQAADTGNIDVLIGYASTREAAGNGEGAERLARVAADAGNADALIDLATTRRAAGDEEGAEDLLRQAADAGSIFGLIRLAGMREAAGDGEGAERLLRQAADSGDADALIHLARTRHAAGDEEGAEHLLLQAADTGNAEALIHLGRMREAAGDEEGAERLARVAADAGNADALIDLATTRQAAGDEEGAEALLLQAVDAGRTDVLIHLARMREVAGDGGGAERFLRRAVDAGYIDALSSLAQTIATAGYSQKEILRNGLEPDGTVSPTW